jgi:hypothetical protein
MIPFPPNKSRWTVPLNKVRDSGILCKKKLYAKLSVPKPANEIVGQKLKRRSQGRQTNPLMLL